MTDSERARLEARLRAAALAYPYPPTPNVAASVRARLGRRARPATALPRRLAWALATLAVALGGLLAVPQVRAALIEFFQIGVVRIFPVAPSATPTPTGTPVATPRPSPTFLPSILELDGETTLTQAQKQVPFPIRLPAYPADLGPPDHVFVQFLDGSVAVLVWLDEGQPGRVRLSLHMIEEGSFTLSKYQPAVLERLAVNNQLALWTEGPYLLEMQDGDLEITRLIEGHVLIWVEGDLTYRLETALSSAEAVKIAESLPPLDK